MSSPRFAAGIGLAFLASAGLTALLFHRHNLAGTPCRPAQEARVAWLRARPWPED